MRRLDKNGKIYFSYPRILYTEKKCTQSLNILKYEHAFLDAMVIVLALQPLCYDFFPTTYIINITVEKENT